MSVPIAFALLGRENNSTITLRLLLSCLSSTNPSLPVFLTALSATSSNGFLRWSFLPFWSLVTCQCPPGFSHLPSTSHGHLEKQVHSFRPGSVSFTEANLSLSAQILVWEGAEGLHWCAARLLVAPGTAFRTWQKSEGQSSFCVCIYIALRRRSAAIPARACVALRRGAAAESCRTSAEMYFCSSKFILVGASAYKQNMLGCPCRN